MFIMEKIAIVTGSSSGIGFETALALARDGYYTYATMRDTKKSSKIIEVAKKENLEIEVLQLDVDKEDTVKNAINKIVSDKKRIDVLVNNAGYGLFGCLEDLSIDDLKSQFETNFFGVVKTIFNRLDDTAVFLYFTKPVSSFLFDLRGQTFQVI